MKAQLLTYFGQLWAKKDLKKPQKLTLSAFDFSSSNDLTTIASACIPLGGVPTDVPSPRMDRAVSRGSTNLADSSPRTQLGTWAKIKKQTTHNK